MALLDGLTQLVQDYAVGVATRAADATVEATKDAASRRTGELADGINHTQVVLNDTRCECEIRSEAPYSLFQDEGTGIYGPTGQRIFPKKGKALAFDWPGYAPSTPNKRAGVAIFRSVAGSPGRHFFVEPMPDRWAQAVLESGRP